MVSASMHAPLGRFFFRATFCLRRPASARLELQREWIALVYERSFAYSSELSV
jgi:hypothetical protein